MVQYFFENFWMIFRMFLMYKMGGGCLTFSTYWKIFGKFWKYWKTFDLGVAKILKKSIE